MTDKNDSSESQKRAPKDRIVSYPHVKVTEKAKKFKRVELAHRHLKKLEGNIRFLSTDGKIMTVKYSAKAEKAIETDDKDWLAKKCDCFKVAGLLYYATWKNNPDKGFFYISGNKKSAYTDYSDLKHGFSAYASILRHRKKAKNRILSQIRSNSRKGVEPKTWQQYVDLLIAQKSAIDTVN